ncbi:MAG TPA: FtsX-like permease family protein [Streptosporangiaceae bacterium]|nr:FtsX-like permease family protein [Streptosporangiaceae bacterium]
MSTVLRERPAELRPTGRDGGAPARRAVVRWAWRMFRREWRQQLLVLALLAAAVAGTTAGAAFAANFPASPTAATFGTAGDLVTISGSDPHLHADIAAIRRRFAPSQVIESQTLAIPGSAATIDLRAQDPAGSYGRSLLALVAGRYPAGPDQVAVTSQVASTFGLRVGSVWHQGGHVRRVTGLVENPQNLTDEFALVAPGQVSSPTQVTILFDAAPASVAGFAFPDGAAAVARPTGTKGISFSVGLVLVLDTLGLLFIGLVAVAGFTVMAQRRLRALGMLGALGATDRNVRLVLLANGAVVGAAGAIAGAVAGAAAWIALAPAIQPYAGHVIGRLALPWPAIAGAMVLAVLTSVAAAWWPARSAARMPVTAALSGRPGSPRPARRLAALGGALLACGLCALVFADDNGGVALLVLVGMVATVLGLAFVGPAVIDLLAAAGRNAPIAVRLALRDLARYKARSGAALAAVSLAAGLAATIVIALNQAAAQAAQTTPTGPNLPANQLIVYASPAGPGTVAPSQTAAQQRTLGARVRAFAGTLHPTAFVPLEVGVRRDQGSYQEAIDTIPANYEAAGLVKSVSTCPPPALEYAGPAYLATPALLARYGIRPGQISPRADLISSRSDLSGDQIASGVSKGCGYASGIYYLTHPVIQTVASLPAYTSDPTTLITHRGMRALGLHVAPAGWLIQTAAPLTNAQISAARQMAAAAGVVVETMSTAPTLAALSYWITLAGLLLGLGVLAMTVGLIRSETAGDLRTLTATGAGGSTRRLLTAATAGSLALAGAVIGTVVAYLAILAWHRSALYTMAHVPAGSLAVILVGLPLAAAAGGWLLAGREPPAIARQPIE